MTDNSIFTTHYMIDMTLLNQYRQLTPAAYQRLFLNSSELHFKHMHADVPLLIANHGISWIMLGTCVEVHSPVTAGEILTSKTWFTWRKGVVYRREHAFYHADGSLAFVGAGFYTVIDMNSRHVIRNPKLLEHVPVNEGPEMLAADSRWNLSMDDAPFVSEFVVRDSWLDMLGHVNNIRYGEMIYDTISEERHCQMKTLSRFDIFYTSEIRKGETMQLKCEETSNEIHLLGARRSDGETSFTAKLIFK